MVILLGIVEIQHFDLSDKGKHAKVKLKEHDKAQELGRSEGSSAESGWHNEMSQDFAEVLDKFTTEAHLKV